MQRALRNISLTLFSLVFIQTSGQAAIVSFSGLLTSGNGVLGLVPPTTPYSITLDFTQSTPGFATINSGLFDSSRGSINISGGDILLIDNGANDQALLSINTTGPIGSLAVTFRGSAISSNQVTTQNLVDLINAAPSTLSANFGTGGNYTASVVSAVPEPSSIMLLSGSIACMVFRRKRQCSCMVTKRI